MNKHLADSDLATPKVTTGPIAGLRKIFSRPDAAPELKVPLREIALDALSGRAARSGLRSVRPLYRFRRADRRGKGPAAHAD